MKKRVCFVTGSRAEFGLLKPLIRRFLEGSSGYEVKIVATGSHLSKLHGFTLSEVSTDFKVDEFVECVLSTDSSYAVAINMSLAISGFSSVLRRLEPDLMVVLGDRYEILSAAVAALPFQVPVAHIHGGEVTRGAIDDSIRHAITKLSHIHFTANEEYRKRVIQLGENPDFVFDVGALGLDSLATEPLFDLDDVKKIVGVDFNVPTAVVTIHPETASGMSPENQIDAFFGAVKYFPNDLQFLITGSNADVGGSQINDLLQNSSQKMNSRVYFRMSLGHKLYASVLRLAKIVIGNSSSGIIEAPFFRVPSVDIGMRQEGRLRAGSVLHSPWDAMRLGEVVQIAYKDKESFCYENPYGSGGAAFRIYEEIDRCIDNVKCVKVFHDLSL